METMILDGFNAFLAAAGTEAPLTKQNPAAGGLQMIGTLVIMMLLFYFMLIRPQSKRAKEHAELLKTVKAGDKVLVSGGIVGVVVAVKEKTVSVRSADAKLEILKSAITEVTERAGANAEVVQS